MRGFVYLIGSKRHSWYKIGRALSPRVRVRELGILLPFELEIFAVWKTVNCVELETYLHKRYAAQRLNGEWFHFNGPDLEVLIEDQNLPLFAERIDVAQPKPRRVKPERLFMQLMRVWLEVNNLEDNGKNRGLASQAVREELAVRKGKNDPDVPNIGVSSASADGTIDSKTLVIQ